MRLLDAGADDYVTKPFGVAELVARARGAAAPQGAAQGPAPVRRWGDVEVDAGGAARPQGAASPFT